eukprot:Plantae.Rhodophyta-Hildenbrandia_rubra.ctg57829.p1 GENE.Plantae.Rhodophyta-Hildenbrandia_rubra.ctg57829~~Plantae.Rhodophyta-Hildenbrandia_rubra.ctg57829.p1  ORF type:complete len:332 (+),score=50.50 Plantae.Rhodophyta-Hildenbrandia_rubra.ctg57829:509-1504(+)
MERADYEEEAGIPPTKIHDAPLSSRPYFEAAALLLMWSVLVLNEGSIRFVAREPAAPGRTAREDANGNRQIPPIVFVVFAAFECAFGILGVIVAAWALIGKGGNVKTTAPFLFIQSLLGWPVFLLYVWAEPAFQAHTLTGPGVRPDLTDGQNKFLIIMGLLGSFSFCLALQGGQFVMGLRLLSYMSGEKVATRSIKMNKGRALFWNGNMLLGGLSTIATALVLLVNVGGGRITPFVSPPNVGVFPVLTLLTGIVMTAHGLLGMASAFSKGLVKFLMIFTVPVYVLMYLNFVIWQLGAIPENPPSFAAGFHSGLVIVVVCIGPYFAYKHSKE